MWIHSLCSIIGDPAIPGRATRSGTSIGEAPSGLLSDAGWEHEADLIPPPAGSKRQRTGAASTPSLPSFTAESAARAWASIVAAHRELDDFRPARPGGAAALRLAIDASPAASSAAAEHAGEAPGVGIALRLRRAVLPLSPTASLPSAGCVRRQAVPLSAAAMVAVVALAPDIAAAAAVAMPESLLPPGPVTRSQMQSAVLARWGCGVS